MEMKMPMKKGSKIWIEFEAIEDLDLACEEIFKYVAPNIPPIGKFNSTQLIFNPRAFNSELLNDMMQVLVKHGFQIPG